MSKWDKSKERKLSLERLKELLSYNNGVLIWRVRCPPRGFAGCVAGTKGRKGYYFLSIDGIKYPRCRLVW